MKALLAALFTLVCLPAFCECPKYMGVEGWPSGTNVYYLLDGAGTGPFSVLDAMSNWNAANNDNGGNGSGVTFLPWSEGHPVDIRIRLDRIQGSAVGQTRWPEGSAVMNNVQIIIDNSKFSGVFRSQEYFTKILEHELGHNMGLDDVKQPVGDECHGYNLGVTIMNQVCGNNDAMGMLPSKPTDCDNNAIKNDPARKKEPRKDPVNCKPCTPNASLCDLRQVCQKVSPEFPDECSLELVCGKPGRDPIACCGDRASSLSATEPCGSWTEINPLPGGFGDYACRIPGAQFDALACAEMGMEPTCSAAGCVQVTIPDLGVTCFKVPGTTPGPNPDPGPGPCVPASCGYSTGEQCRWLPDGCGKQHLCGTCGPSCVPGYNEAGEPIMDCSGGGPPACDGAHNEVCYPSFKACSDECCGVCERRIGCGGESAHKCFEP